LENFMRGSMTFTTTLFLSLGLGGLAAAHDTWLLPARFAVPAGASVDVAMTSGMSFPKNESPVAADRLAGTGVRAPGAAGELKVRGARNGALRLSAALPRDGVAVLWAMSRPRTLDLEPGDVAHYLEEIGQADTVGKAWEARGRPKWRETYSKAAKTFVRVGKGGGEAWRDSVDLPLELVPESDPTLVKAGDLFTLRLLWQGNPGERVPVVAVGPEGKPHLLRPDAEGRVSFSITRPGPWLFKATRIAEITGGAEWESQFTTLTVKAKASTGATNR